MTPGINLAGETWFFYPKQMLVKLQQRAKAMKLMFYVFTHSSTA